jgi:hypothetical protein
MNAYYYVLILMLLGALLGAFSAYRWGGKGLDIAQYAAVFCIIGAILGFLLTIVLARLA